jgi:hypothetical protein
VAEKEGKRLFAHAHPAPDLKGEDGMGVSERENHLGCMTMHGEGGGWVAICVTF